MSFIKPFASIISLVMFSVAGILHIDKEVKLRKEKEFWSQPSYSFKATSCRDDRKGQDCAIFNSKGIASVLLLPSMKRVYLEGYLGIGTDRPIKLLVEHGYKGKKVSVPAGYKLASCFCNQEECLIKAPDSPIYLDYNGIWDSYSFSKIKPAE